MRFRIYPYKMTSVGAKLLAQTLGAKRLYDGVSRNSNYYHRQLDLVVNWGNSTIPFWWNNSRKFLNHPDAVKKATNKLTTLQALFEAGVNVPEFTTDKAEAFSWFNDNKVVVGRGTLSGHSGQDIKLLVPELDNWDSSYFPLYTKHIRHKREFRVHVFCGRVIDVTEKKKRRGEETNSLVRSHTNGWVFCRENIVVPSNVIEQSIKAVQALGLHFGAVDVGYREREDKAYVFEVNTSPGLEGTTLQKYVEAIRDEI